MGGRGRAETLVVETLAGWTLGHQTLGDYDIGRLGRLQLMLKGTIPAFPYIIAL